MYVQRFTVFAVLGLMACAPFEAPSQSSNLSEGTVQLRLVAGNLSSGSSQSYQAPGLRILDALDADVAALQEFSFAEGRRAFVDQAFGPSFTFFAESASLPNGVVSRFPIVRSGVWEDPFMGNREFVWSQMDIPGNRDLWVLSVHLKAGSEGLDATRRYCEAEALVNYLRCPATNPSVSAQCAGLSGTAQTCPTDQLPIPVTDFVVLAGDFNTASRDESAVTKLAEYFVVDGAFPQDAQGNTNTNSSRARPFDWVLTNRALHDLESSVTIQGRTSSVRYERGVVFDTRRHTSEQLPAPALVSDSGEAGMQHMAVVREFVIPTGVNSTDGGVDGGRRDSGTLDAGPRDSSVRDSSVRDSAVRDSSVRDSGVSDSAVRDSAAQDAGRADSSTSDAQPPVTPIEWQHSASLESPDNRDGAVGRNHSYGRAVALSADGQTLVVGAARHRAQSLSSWEDSTTSDGALFIYRRNGVSWVWQQSIYGAAYEHLGTRVAISADANVIAASTNSTVRVLERVGASYVMTADLANPAPSPIEYPSTEIGGASIALSGSGDRLAFRREDRIGSTVLGVVSVFARSSTGWGPVGSLSSTGSQLFGTGLSFTTNGQTLAVGAPDLRQAFLYSITANGLLATVTFSAPEGASRWFGNAVSITDGNTLVVADKGYGAPGENSLGEQSGAVHIYRRSGSTWPFVTTLNAPGGWSGDRFGHAVSLSLDGRSLLVSAVDQNGRAAGVTVDTTPGARDSGAAYLFQRIGSAPWTFVTMYKGARPRIGDHFGASIAMSGSADVVVSGAPDIGLGPNAAGFTASGMVFVYLRP